MLLALSDATFWAAIGTAIAAIVPAALAYHRATRSEKRTNDLDTLREIIRTLQVENSDKSVAITDMRRAIDACEREKDDLQHKMFDLQLEVFKLKMGAKDA